jgi:hypothetical protein
MKKAFLCALASAVTVLACATDENAAPDDAVTGDLPDTAQDPVQDTPADVVGTDDGGPDIPTDGEVRLCTIDLVFAVDNSSSMQEEIGDFRMNVWPQFAMALLEVSGGVSGEPFRVAVLDACPNPATYHVRGRSGACNFDSGMAWMDSDSANLIEEFQCVGDIWDEDSTCTGNNDDEQPASAAAASFESPWIDPGSLNEGFLRNDALLIVIAITDEDEQPVPAADADMVYQRLIKAKGDDPKKMVFLGIGGSRDCDGPYGSADHAEKLEEITGLFMESDRGLFWDLCEGSLEEGLTEAMSVIDTACHELMI